MYSTHNFSSSQATIERQVTNFLEIVSQHNNPLRIKESWNECLYLFNCSESSKYAYADELKVELEHQLFNTDIKFTPTMLNDLSNFQDSLESQYGMNENYIESISSGYIDMSTASSPVGEVY
jgi:hypothetical protein